MDMTTKGMGRGAKSMPMMKAISKPKARTALTKTPTSFRAGLKTRKS